MKLKISVAAIIISTVSVIGLISLVVNKTSRSSAPSLAIKDNDHVDAKDNSEKFPSDLEREKNKTPKAKDADSEDLLELEPDDDDELEAPSAPLSEEDRKKINEVANLSEAELTKELDALKVRIEDEDLFELLEAGELSADKKNEAKELLERFALLGLEGTRRKYMNVEPELKDAFYAHRDSLREIRELLSDD